MQDTLPDYTTIPEPPASMGAGAVLGRLADGIGFRYRWATEGLGAADMSFKPAPGCMTLGDLLSHIVELLSWVAENMGMEGKYELVKSADIGVLRARTLELAACLSARFKALPDNEVAAVKIRSSRGDTLPVWNIVNGPLSDSLTHIGQVLSWRRMAGTPAAAADVLRGRPPRSPAPQA
jgi:hypothetical protein